VLEIRLKLGKKKKVPGGGEAETSPEAGMARLAATLPVEVRLKNLGWGVVVIGVRWLPEFGKIGGFRVGCRILRFGCGGR
jgi:hypothetical protein